MPPSASLECFSAHSIVLHTASALMSKSKFSKKGQNFDAVPATLQCRLLYAGYFTGPAPLLHTGSFTATTLLYTGYLYRLLYFTPPATLQCRPHTLSKAARSRVLTSLTRACPEFLASASTWRSGVQNKENAKSKKKRTREKESKTRDMTS
jgi:hypothetical protein